MVKDVQRKIVNLVVRVRTYIDAIDTHIVSTFVFLTKSLGYRQIN